MDLEDLFKGSRPNLNDALVNQSLCGKVILITGGAGSIGSELVRQVAAYQPERIIVLDISETLLYELKLELTVDFDKVNFSFVLGDIRNKNRLGDVFKQHNISVVYHAAAYKQLPLLEDHPREAVDVNVMGTMHIADLCVEYKVERFVYVSTDKAVNPTSVMGASKRAAEIYVQSLKKNQSNSTRFLITRFGNVIGSHGSVIPRFEKQIERGGPVTVTHKDIQRYFMTIEEACQLVLQAGAMGIGGEIFVFDMGDPVNIYSLAKKMIRSKGLQPNKDVIIEITGLRPGEKLSEELRASDNQLVPTQHEKITAFETRILSHEEALRKLSVIINASEKDDQIAVVKGLKSLIPEYKSENSRFEQLDKLSN